MPWIHYASSFLAISQLLFMGLFYVVHYRQHLLGRLIALLSAALIAYIVSRMPEVTASVIPSSLAVTAPALLWIIARYLFEDNPQVHPLIWALLVSYISLRVAGLAFYDGSQGPETWFFRVFFYIPQLVMLGLSCHVVFMAVRGLGSDLVEPRRRLRVPFAIGMGVIVGLIVGSGFFLLSSVFLDSVYFFTLFLLILFINLATFRLHEDSPQLISSAEAVPADPVAPADGPEENDAERRLIERINKAMEVDRLYTQAGLTIGDLAGKVSIQEYRLRRLINQKLHYRNFNQYLNSYRIKEAARLLRDPAHGHLSISAIALEVGYSSLSSFNKAFKEIHGLTPSAYRGSVDSPAGNSSRNRPAI